MTKKESCDIGMKAKQVEASTQNNQVSGWNDQLPVMQSGQGKTTFIITTKQYPKLPDVISGHNLEIKTCPFLIHCICK